MQSACGFETLILISEREREKKRVFFLLCFFQDLITEKTENTCDDTGGISVVIHMVSITIALCATTFCVRLELSRGANRLNRNSSLSEVELDTGESAISSRRIHTPTQPKQDSYSAAQEDHGCLCLSLPFPLFPVLTSLPLFLFSLFYSHKKGSSNVRSFVLFCSKGGVINP
jgi:hypothetical protein